MPRSKSNLPFLEEASQNRVHLSEKPRFEYVQGTLDQMLRLFARLFAVFLYKLPAEVGIGGFQAELKIRARMEMFQEWFSLGCVSVFH